MKHTKMIPKYEAEINKLAEDHLMALLNLHTTSFSFTAPTLIKLVWS